MFGLFSAPPQPTAGMPSLEPSSPLSGTVGVSSNVRRRLLRHSPPSAPLSPILSSPSPNTSDTPASERLDQLVTFITGVLKAYAALPNHSLAYLASLKDFHQRAMELDPNAVIEQAQTQSQRQGRLQRSSPESPTRSRYTPSSSFHHHNINHVNNLYSLPERARPGPKVEPNAAEVDKLEREWWSSEVVAAWYGPRPGSRVLNERSKARKDGTERNNGMGSERQANIKREGSSVVLNDE